MIILVGPSASGKTEIVKYLIKYFSYTKFVTTTTRNIRVNEINGIDYNFISTAEFLDKIKNNEFIEFVNYNNNYYGTEKRNINDSTCLIIEPSGLKAFKQLNNPTIISFYLETKKEIRKQRMIERKDKIEDINMRLNNDDSIFKKEKISQYIDFYIDTNYESIKDLAIKINKLYKEKLNKIN